MARAAVSGSQTNQKNNSTVAGTPQYVDQACGAARHIVLAWLATVSSSWPLMDFMSSLLSTEKLRVLSASLLDVRPSVVVFGSHDIFPGRRLRNPGSHQSLDGSMLRIASQPANESKKSRRPPVAGASQGNSQIEKEH